MAPHKRQGNDATRKQGVQDNKELVGKVASGVDYATGEPGFESHDKQERRIPDQKAIKREGEKVALNRTIYEESRHTWLALGIGASYQSGKNAGHTVMVATQACERTCGGFNAIVEATMSILVG
ncbi:hypothetical protein EPI10_016697 [Gossypium australe]|uniref:Uncharacterized protein n=1 Tax=Gossypium australe TaxID=47621 RepID=A0A5B6VPF9_9ROSI|nr:hypothetical protein EPI10_016697 [Gossypium australe]